MGNCNCFVKQANKYKAERTHQSKAPQLYIDEVDCSSIKVAIVSENSMKEDLHRNIVALLGRDTKYNRVIRASGFLISKNLVLTCAHIFYRNMLRLDNSIFQVYPKQCGPLGKFYRIEKAFIPQQYIQSPVQNAIIYDYALVKLAENVESDNFLTIKSSFKNRQQKLAIYGYPNQKYQNTGINNIQSVHQWGISMSNAIVQVRESRGQILHSISTLKGQSGSPIVQIQGNELSIVGIHKGGIKTIINDEQVILNTGKLITQEVLQTLKKEAFQMGAAIFKFKSAGYSSYKKLPTFITATRDNNQKPENGHLIISLQQLQKHFHQMVKFQSGASYLKIVNLIRQMSDSQKQSLIQLVQNKISQNQIPYFCLAVVQQYAQITILLDNNQQYSAKDEY